MLYNHRNAAGATVIDCQTGERIGRVVNVDTDAAVVRCTHEPLRLTHDGGVLLRELVFDAVHAVFGDNSPTPRLFLCHGRRQ